MNNHIALWVAASSVSARYKHQPQFTPRRVDWWQRSANACRPNKLSKVGGTNDCYCNICKIPSPDANPVHHTAFKEPSPNVRPLPSTSDPNLPTTAFRYLPRRLGSTNFAQINSTYTSTSLQPPESPRQSLTICTSNTVPRPFHRRCRPPKTTSTKTTDDRERTTNDER